MMHFIQPALDEPLLSELKEMSLLPPQAIESICARLGHPETGTLDQFLLAGADLIPEREWLSWLIRRHGAHRFGRVAWTAEAAGWAANRIFGGPNLPFRAASGGAPLIALMRPDRWAETEAGFRGVTPLRAAATLGEVRELKAAWAEWEVGGGTEEARPCPTPR